MVTVHMILQRYGCPVITRTLIDEYSARNGVSWYDAMLDVKKELAGLKESKLVWYCRYKEGKGWHLKEQGAFLLYTRLGSAQDDC